MATGSSAKIGQLVQELMERRLGSFWTALLARVEEVDHKTCRAKVRPLAKLPVGPDRWEELPELFEVPIDIARAGPFYVRRPYRKGDIVLLVVLSHSLERVLHDHTPREPGAAHINNLQDVVVLGGFRADSDPERPDAWINDLIVQNEETLDVVVFRQDGGMDVALMGGGNQQEYTIKVDVMRSGRLRSSRGKWDIEAASKIRLGGDRAQYRVVLGEPLLQWLNSHVHIGVTPGDGVTGPPASPAGESLLSKLAWVAADAPGRLPDPETHSLRDVPPPPLSDLGRAASWLASLGVNTSAPNANWIQAILDVIGAVGQALADAAGDFVGTLGKYVLQLGQEAVEALTESVVEVLQEDWLQLLGLALTNPGAAVSLFVDKVAMKVFAKMGDEAVEMFFDALGDWCADHGLTALANYLADIDGIDDLGEFLDGAGEIVGKLVSGDVDWEEMGKELVQWAWEEYGEDGLKGAAAAVLSAIISWFKQNPDKAAGDSTQTTGGG